VVEESRWAAQQETKQREVQQATMFDAAHDCIVTLDPEGIITYWNRGAERLYGWTTQEAEGQNANALLRTRFPESREVLWPKLMESGLWEGELTQVTRDGVPVTVASSWTLMKDEGGNASAILEISSDVTERKRAEAALHGVQEELRRAEAIFEALQAGIMLIDPTTHKIVDVNTTAAHLFGAPKEAIIGSVCHQFICPAEVGCCPITDLGQTVDKAERVLLTADGKSRPILKSVSKISLGGHAYLLENFIDISDRKQMERALLESEGYYRAIFESTAAGMAILDEDMTVAMGNSKLEQLTGFSKNEVEGLKPWTEFVAPEDLERIKTYHRARRRDEGSAPKEYELRLLTKDGTRREVFVTAALIPGTKRSVVSIVDVTALKTAQEAVQKQASMLDAAWDSIMTLDLEGTITYWNRGAERLYGWTTQEAEGQNANALLRTTFPESREELWRKLKESGLWEGELIHVTRDDVPVTVASSWTLLRDEKGNAYATLEINSDITERKKAESALAESEATLRITLATMVDGILTGGLDWKVTDCNEAVLRMSQRSKEEVIGKPFLDLLAPEYRSQILETVPELMERGNIRTDALWLKKNGETVDVEANVSLIKDAAGQPTAFLTVARDVTERKRMEQQLDSTLADLKRSNAELEQFAYSASHDLQEPLRMITSYTQIMEEDYKGKLDADADQYIAFTVEGAKRMQTLIDDLLAYSRVGTRGEPFIPTSMNSVLSEAIANLQVAIEESHAVVTHDQLPTVLGDESQLIQLFQNLLGNAIKFRGDDAPVIHVGVEETKDGWVFSVRDNGIGIDMKNAERIFTVFQRLHARDEYPGTGIGLAVVKKIVERHGGRIWVESALAQGSTFYFTLRKREDNVL
jgi:PAS domain S-box-containing protein